MAIRPTISAYGGGVQQFPVFLNKAFVGYQFEKTERDLMDAINQSVKEVPDKAVNLVGANGVTIPSVVGARKSPNTNAIGGDNLTDVIVFTRKGSSLKINTKGSIAPVQTITDTRAVFAANPALAKRFVMTAIQKYKSLGYQDGQAVDQKVTGIYAELRGEHNKRIITGTPQLGGPVDYFFEGTPTGTPDEQGNIQLNGNLISALDLHKSTTFFLQMQKPPQGSSFDFKSVDNFGLKIIHDMGGREISVIDRSFISAGSTVIRI